MSKWIVQNWVGNRVFPNEEFDSFEDGWGHIYDHVDSADNAYDDLYVVEDDA